MAPAGKDATPGRRKKTGQQYFDVGKVGRKTGITLKDTGIRDEHGMEPVSGIFSSPGGSPDQIHGEKTLASEGMDVEESTAPDVRSALNSRKHPRYPPPKQSPYKRTSIGGSPKRMSSARPQTRGAISEEPDEDSPRSRAVNRKIDFGGVNRNRKSLHVVDAESPFKPKHKLRRSTGPATRPSVYDYETDGTALETIEQTQTNGLGEDESVELSIEGDDEPAPVDDYDSAPVDIEQLDVSFEEPARRKRGRPRKSDQSNASQTQESPKTSGIASSSGAKRSRTSLRDETEVEAGPSRKKTRTSGGSTIVEQQGEEVEIDPADIAHGDEYLDAMGQEDQPQLDSQLEAQPEPGPTKKGKGGRPRGKKGKAVAALKPGEGAKGSPIKINASPSKKRSGSAGPMSNVNLRAHTPFDDANQTTSRAGRNLIQPLKFWANENRIWKNGEIEGIIRAEPVEQSRRKPLKRKKRSRKRLHDIEEESDSESIMPDEWEDNMGVITGNVASWNPETRQGDPEDPYQEDLAFAASSIITRDVAGSDFKYAKIMTLPFFGAGIVEIPPEGYKRAKNSRKMQMVFFVHQGKVSVEVGATGMEVNSFPLSKGGVWIVPRGNNYAITNESKNHTARIFFAQGCEIEKMDNALSQ